MTSRTLNLACAFALLLTLTAASEVRAQTTLYERLGGKPAVTAVTSALVDRILADTRINAWFAHAAATPENTAAYKEKLYEFVCEATGGPCKYTGKDMVTAHRGRAVTSGAFDAVVEDLVAVLDSLKVPEEERRDLLALLAPLKTSIVQR